MKIRFKQDYDTYKAGDEIVVPDDYGCNLQGQGVADVVERKAGGATSVMAETPQSKVIQAQVEAKKGTE